MFGDWPRLMKDSRVFTLPKPIGAGHILTFTEAGEPVMKEPSIQDIVARNKLREPGQVKTDIDDLLMQLEMSYGCLSMVHDALKQCGVDTSDLPPMFYEEGLIEAIQRKGRELANKDLASIGAFPGVAATHKYVAIEENGNKGYVRVPIDKEVNNGTTRPKTGPKRPRRRAAKNAAPPSAA